MDEEKQNAEVKAVKARVAAAEKELERVNGDIETARGTLADIKGDVDAFAAMRREVEGYKHRLVKVGDLDALEEKITELETRLTAVESKTDTPEP